jgi:hypothetical protein
MQRFWGKVDKDANGCWLWTAGTGRDGYGKFSFGYKTIMAHRMAYELVCGEIPIGMKVLHSCDVRSCVNPRHLFLGTNDDNSKDMVRKGRQAKGERAHNVKLTAHDIVAIRECKLPQATTAKQYGVTQAAISLIVVRKNWKHIA